MPWSFSTFEPGISGMGLFALPVAAYPGGAVLFVNSATGVDGRGRVRFPGTSGASPTGGVTQGPVGDPFTPLATIAYALTLCQSGRGDVIFVQGGHVEPITGTLQIPQNAVSIIGLPAGHANNRPTLRPQTTGSVLFITGANCVFANLRFDLTVVTSIATGVNVSGAGNYFFNCFWLMATSTNAAVQGVVLTGAGDSVFEFCDCDATASVGAASWLDTVLTTGQPSQRVVIRRCDIRGDFSKAPIGSSTPAHLINLLVEDSSLVQLNGTAKVVLNFTGSSTGLVRNNSFTAGPGTATATAAVTSTSTSMRFSQNFGLAIGGAAATSGILTPGIGVYP